MSVSQRQHWDVSQSQPTLSEREGLQSISDKIVDRGHALRKGHRQQSCTVKQLLQTAGVIKLIQQLQEIICTAQRGWQVFKPAAAVIAYTLAHASPSTLLLNSPANSAKDNTKCAGLHAKLLLLHHRSHSKLAATPQV